MFRSNHRRCSIKKAFLKLDEIGLDVIMSHICSLHFGIIIFVFVFYPEAVEQVFLKISQN